MADGQLLGPSKADLARLTDLEQLLTQQELLIKEMSAILERFEGQRDAYRRLRAYYGSKDYQKDLDWEELGLWGQLPRGVLSQDGIYNVLMAYHQLGLQFSDLGRQLLEEEKD